MKILFASKNKNKYNEIKEIFNKDYEFVFKNNLKDVVEDKNTICCLDLQIREYQGNHSKVEDQKKSQD